MLLTPIEALVNKERITVWLRPQERKALARISKKQKVSRSEVIGHLLTNAIV